MPERRIPPRRPRNAASESATRAARTSSAATTGESRHATPPAKRTATGTSQRPSPATSRRAQRESATAAPARTATQRRTFTPHGVTRSSQSPSEPTTSDAPSTPSPSFVLSSIGKDPPSVQPVEPTLARADNSEVHNGLKSSKVVGEPPPAGNRLKHRRRKPPVRADPYPEASTVRYPIQPRRTSSEEV